MGETVPVGGDVVKRWLLVSALVVGSFAVGCARSDSDAAPPTSKAPTSTSAPDEPEEEFVAEADDFVNLADMTPVRGFFVDNRLGALDETLAVANSPEGGIYPVGTIIQLIPQEAMVKRGGGFDPTANDWEFFELDTSSEGTVIHQRGKAEIENRFGSGSCSSCHAVAGDTFDFVCEDTHGCEPLPVSDELILDLQQNDARPRR
jgi:hypothetical protein